MSTSVPMRSRTSNDVPEKLLTVKDLARAANVADHVVRFYARTGLIRATRQAANGYRQFLQFDAQRIRFVRVAQSLGFSLAEIREILRRSRQGSTPCPLVRDIIARRLVENREHLEYVSALQNRMQRASKLWRRMPDRAPHGEALCGLIEAMAHDAPIPSRAKQPRRKQFPVRRRRI